MVRVSNEPTIEDPKFESMAKEFRRLQDYKRELAKEVKNTNKTLALLEKNLIEYLELHDMEMVRVKGVVTLFTKEGFTAYVTKENRAEAIKYLVDRGYEDALIYRPDEKKLPGIVKAILSNPDEVVPDYFVWNKLTTLGYKRLK